MAPLNGCITKNCVPYKLYIIITIIIIKSPKIFVILNAKINYTFLKMHCSNLQVAIVVEFVVRGEGDQTTPGCAEGEEDLSRSIQPHLATRQ